VTDVNVKDWLESINQDIFVSYDGSLTTPPCTEGVKWSLLMKVQPICTRQLKAFTARYADDPTFADGRGNNRVTLPYNDRTIYYSGFI
jgi:carbonic anhydrase